MSDPINLVWCGGRVKVCAVSPADTHRLKGMVMKTVNVAAPDLAERHAGLSLGREDSAASAPVSTVLLRDGTAVTIRPINRQDVALERRFIEALSPASRRFRFLETMHTPSEALLRQLTDIRASSEAAYVAVITVHEAAQEIGVARFSAQDDKSDCEFAIVVSDAWQNKGLGTFLMRRLMDDARARGITAMHSNDAADNDLMRKFAASLHLGHHRDPADARQVIYTIDLDVPQPAA